MSKQAHCYYRGYRNKGRATLDYGEKTGIERSSEAASPWYLGWVAQQIGDLFGAWPKKAKGSAASGADHQATGPFWCHRP